jgi:hypothetical protein
MFNAFSLKLGVFVVLLFSFKGADAQTIFEGQVLDQFYEKPVPSVTVALTKTKIVTLTNQQGYFSIEADVVVPSDTLVFSSIGYITKRLAVSDYTANLFVLLIPSNSTLEEVNITNRKLKLERLREFTNGDIGTGPGNPQSKYQLQYAYAKLFDSKRSNLLLKQIDLGRYIAYAMPRIPVKTVFLLHIMAVDSKTESPGKITYTKQIELEDRSYWVSIDLSKDNIVIPTNRFFVCLEWQQVPMNEIVNIAFVDRLYNVKPNGKQRLEDVSEYKVSYQPIFIGYHRNKQAVSYTKITGGHWERNKVDLKYGGQELALSVTYKY